MSIHARRGLWISQEALKAHGEVALQLDVGGQAAVAGAVYNFPSLGTEEWQRRARRAAH